MVVSEGKQLVATQIAYADLDTALDDLGKNGTKTVSLADAVKYAKERNLALGGLSNYINPDGTFKPEYSYLNDWNLLSARNENTPDGTGFYACILDTGDARILACRGSESMTDMTNFKQDWYDADLKLLNSERTTQEAALERYMNDSETKKLLEEKPWVSTGHSLGGHLADHAAIYSAEAGIKNYAGTINFDGAGHSQEYINAHRDAIDKVSGKMVHKKASIVGSLLFDIPGVKQEYIQTSHENRFDAEKRIDGLEGLAYPVLRHGTEYWVVDENGATIPRDNNDPDGTEWVIEKVTRLIDRLPPVVGNTLVEVINIAAISIFTIGDFLKKNPAVSTLLVASAVAFVLANPLVIPFAIGLAFEVIVVVVFVTLIAAGIEFLIEKIEEFGKFIAEKICEFVDWLAGKAAEVFEAIQDFVNGIREWFRNKFNKGAKYVKEHPYFKADTDRLYHYAARLQRVNSRLSSLDSGMRSLYWQVGFLDLWDILCANLLTCESSSLNKAKNYLMDTADRLNTADGKARGYLEG